MKRKIIVFFIAFIIYLISFSFKKEIIIKENTKEGINDTKELVYLTNKTNVELEEYVVGVVACEMPASFNNEALKAMSVASRTYAKYKMSKGSKLKTDTSDQCYISVEEMKKKWGKNYNKYYNRVLKAVNSTKNEYMTYEGKPIIAFYFSISNGKTENVQNVFSQKLDYLVSVDSSWDKKYYYKKSVKEMNISDFKKKLGINGDIKKIEYIRSSSSRVDYLLINNKKIKGTVVRNKLGLRSTDFNIELTNKIKITTLGYGHGVGMSQYGAEAMANLGYKYDDILNHYYKGIKIVNK